MSDMPERLWAVPEYNCTVYMSGNSPITAQTGPFEHRLHGKAIEYVRADLSDALLREAMEALIGVIPTHRFVGNFCWCHAARDTDAGHTADCLKARATLAKLRAHLGVDK